jgi:hypothetical protein
MSLTNLVLVDPTQHAFLVVLVVLTPFVALVFALVNPVLIVQHFPQVFVELLLLQLVVALVWVVLLVEHCTQLDPI